ncbi:MAG: PLP-dependent aminotransferase family protein [Myxococcales bacterium]|nr:MAG: PLP-dependent aminotransferase family protein [Myxococcales bacterium]
MANDAFAHLYSRSARTVQPSAIRELCKLGDRPEIRSLAGGWPDPAIFPAEDILDIAEDLLVARPGRLLQYCPTEGLRELRAAVVKWANEKDGIPVTESGLLITHGSMQGLDLAARVLIDPGDVILCGRPTYFGATGAFRALGGAIAGVPLDDEGMDPEALAETLARLAGEGKRAKAIYVIPNFDNPSGTTLPLARRERILELVHAHDLLLIEDDPYGELRFEGESIPSFAALDRVGRVIHLRSFSKTFAPGLRLAWLAADPALVRKLTISKQFVDACTNSFGQAIAAEFIARGLLEKSIARNIAVYREKRDWMFAALEKHFPPEVRWTRPMGGFFVWVKLPDSIDASDLLSDAMAKNVVFVAGAPFYDGEGGRNTLRLTFSMSDRATIESAVAEIGSLIRARLAHGASPA